MATPTGQGMVPPTSSKMWIVDLRQDRRAVKRGTEKWVNVATAARRTAEGRVAVMLDQSLPGPDGEPRPEPPTIKRKLTLGSEVETEESPEKETHLFMLSRACLVTESTGGRRRLHHFEPATDVHFEAEQRPMAELLLRLGSASQALPPPGKRHTLVRLDAPTEVAGLRLHAGAVAALDFDPLSVLPQLRSLGLYPWHVLTIEQLDESGCHGSALENIRLVVHLDHPWQPLRSPGFLAGVFVDTTYRDYRRQLPSGRVLRAYFTHGDRRPPRAVLADAKEP